MHTYHWQYQAILNSAGTLAWMGHKHCSWRGIAHTGHTDACWYSTGGPWCCCLRCFSLRVLQNRKPFCRLGRLFPFATRPVICSRCHHRSHCPGPWEDAAKGRARWSGALCWVNPECNPCPCSLAHKLAFFWNELKELNANATSCLPTAVSITPVKPPTARSWRSTTRCWTAPGAVGTTEPNATWAAGRATFCRSSEMTISARARFVLLVLRDP